MRVLGADEGVSDVFIVSDFGFAYLSASLSARPPPLALKQVDLLSLGEIIAKRGFTTTPLALKPSTNLLSLG